MTAIWAPVVSALCRFGTSRRGHFAALTALLAVPLLTAVGLAVDYSRVVRTHAQLMGAADAAALASISSSSPGRRFGFDMNGDGLIPPAAQDGAAFFRANVPDDEHLRITKVRARAWRKDGEFVSRVRFEAELDLFFARFLGMDKVELADLAEARIHFDAAIDFHLLLDNTPSMGVGATLTDINKLVANTPDKCAFACHALNDGDNYYNLAKDLGVAMRIDVVRQATQNLTETAKDTRKHAMQFRMAVYSFGQAATALGLFQVAELTHNLEKVRNATDALDLMTIPYQGYDNDQQTNFDQTLADLNAIIPDPGSGLDGDDPQQVVFFVSDGVGDSYKPVGCSKKTTNGRCQEPINTAQCTALKARGIKVAVLYTTYLPLPTNWWYNTWIGPFQSEIGTKMRECATPGLFFEVSPSQGISEAMDALFLQTLQMLRLSS